jgi:hypothetical protein
MFWSEEIKQKQLVLQKASEDLTPNDLVYIVLALTKTNKETDLSLNRFTSGRKEREEKRKKLVNLLLSVSERFSLGIISADVFSFQILQYLNVHDLAGLFTAHPQLRKFRKVFENDAVFKAFFERDFGPPTVAPIDWIKKKYPGGKEGGWTWHDAYVFNSRNVFWIEESPFKALEHVQRGGRFIMIGFLGLSRICGWLSLMTRSVMIVKSLETRMLLPLELLQFNKHKAIVKICVTEIQRDMLDLSEINFIEMIDGLRDVFKTEHVFWEYVSMPEKYDTAEFAIKVVSKHPYLIRKFNLDVQGTKYVIHEVIKVEPLLISVAAEHLRNDIELLKVAVSGDYRAASFASDNIKSGLFDRLIKIDERTFQFAGRYFRNDKHIVSDVFARDPEMLLFASPELKSDSEFVFDLFKTKPCSDEDFFLIMQGDDDLRGVFGDDEFVLSVLKITDLVIQYVSLDLLNDRVFVFRAGHVSKNILRHIGQSLMKNEQFVQDLIKEFPGQKGMILYRVKLLEEPQQSEEFIFQDDGGIEGFEQMENVMGHGLFAEFVEEVDRRRLNEEFNPFDFENIAPFDFDEVEEEGEHDD